MQLLDYVQEHELAMRKLEEAQLAKLARDRDAWDLAMRDALKLERDAASHAAHGDTRSGLHRSAATLAFNMGELEQAEALALVAMREASGWTFGQAKTLYRKIRWTQRRKAVRAFFRFAV